MDAKAALGAAMSYASTQVSAAITRTNFNATVTNYVDSLNSSFWVQGYSSDANANYAIQSVPLYLSKDVQYAFGFGYNNTAFNAKSPIKQITLFDASNTVLGHIDFSSLTPTVNTITFTISSATYPTYSYAKLELSSNNGGINLSPSILIGLIPQLMIVKGTLSHTFSYVPYYGLMMINPNFINLPINNLNFYQNSTNLYNFSNLTANYSLDSSAGWLVAKTGWIVSDYISVDPTQQLYLSHSVNIYCYDTNKNYIKILTNLKTTYDMIGIVALPSNCAYIRWTADNTTSIFTSGTPAMFCQSNVPVDFKMPYVIPRKYLEINNYYSSWWNGKNLCTQGDSITANNEYQPYLVNKYGFILTNTGIGGTCVTIDNANGSAMWQDTRVNAIPTNTDVLIFMGGANDFINNVPIGTIADTGTTTFYGAYQTALNKMYTRVPNAIIILMNLPWSTNDNTPNTNNNTYQDFRDAIGAISKKYGYPLVDLLSAGINNNNYTVYMQSGSGIHQNDLGGGKLASVIDGTLKIVEPIA